MASNSKLKNWIFSKTHQNKLIYNTCWEDPRCDRMLMNIQEDSKILMITSAGCNALAYLLDNPAHIHCVDMNYRQNALLELKKAGLKTLDYKQFFCFFGKGHCTEAKDIYLKKLRALLNPDAKRYWDKHIKYFSGKGLRKSFYYRGTSGLLAYSVTKLMKLKKQIRHNLNYLFNAVSLEEQQKYFSALESTVFNRIVKQLLNNHYTMTLAGVPVNQQNLIKETYAGGMMEYIKESFKKIFTTLDISENYFYQVYVKGAYTPGCCPDYLKDYNFNQLRSTVDHIHTYTSTISDYLKNNPGVYSHFVLLDHQDWLATNHPKALQEEWELILKNSKPGTKILLRSAAKEVDFFPDFVTENIYFDKQKANEIHDLDRVGTYASVYLGIVQ